MRSGGRSWTLSVTLCSGVLGAACATLVLTSAAAAPRAFCRLDWTPWVACDAMPDLHLGWFCGCPASAQHDRAAYGIVELAPDAVVLIVTDPWVKTAIGADAVQGQVKILIPRRIVASSTRALAAGDRRLRDIYDVVTSLQRLQSDRGYQ